MTTADSSDDRSISLEVLVRVEKVCDQFESDWNAWQHATPVSEARPRLEDYFAGWDEPHKSQLFHELFALEIALRRHAGEDPNTAEYASRFPTFASIITDKLDTATESKGDQSLVSTTLQGNRRPQGCAEQASSRTTEPDGSTEKRVPESIGRYEVRGLLGRGAFGCVYLAYDGELDRQVAVKVQQPREFTAEEQEAYLREACVVADLDHPHIVPIYDAGQMDDGRRYAVAKLIDGTNLAERIAQQRVSHEECANVIATVADALHYAHRQGLVHRDVKPANILVDTLGKPFIADFGMALREQDVGKGPKYAGTPTYMSPEQARGEGHRVDGRSDIFSLGAVLYELLVGRRAFHADTRSELIEQITSYEPRPPRQYDDNIPKELERICLKCLSKRSTERYTTAKDMADDLRHFLDTRTESSTVARGPQSTSGRSSSAATATAASAAPDFVAGVATGSSTDTRPIKIVPKGLRSFDEHDVDFFLELLPGARDRDGLPESIRFWKTRIEERDSDRTFAVGLIYGPSGCGKTSLVRAGLLPRLANHIIPVFVECTASDTETRLMRLLRKVCPSLRPNEDLIETLMVLRRRHGPSPHKKVCIVLDQFEQWLHAHGANSHADLIHALRQCDGASVQCIVLVRDDFWLAVSRFFDQLDIDLSEGQNFALVDLFDQLHARKVLAEFGRAYGCLPDNLAELSSDHESFLDRVIADLLQQGRVISVRLALFAEMVKGRPWSPAILKELGGTEGIGQAFLEETFGSAAANPKYRQHQKAAGAVLKALLPETGTNIKGNMRPAAQLREISGYVNRPRDFEELLRILDAETRLLTPAEPEVAMDDPSRTDENREKYYQLTHDYLVPALREWLARKQKDTRRGRAELRLAERAAEWRGKQDSRHLPGCLEYLSIRSQTRKSNWTKPQRTMMRKADSYYALRGFLISLVVCSVSVAGLLVRRNVLQQRADDVVNAMLTARPDGVPLLLEEMEHLRTYVLPILHQTFENYSNPNQRLRAAFGLVRFSDVKKNYLEYVIAAIGPDSGNETRNIVAALREDHASAIENMRQLASHEKDLKQRARLAIALLHLGDLEVPQSMLADIAPDPIQRTIFVDTFPSCYGELVELRDVLRSDIDSAFRSGLCCALAGVSSNELTATERTTLLPTLQVLYDGEPDPGLHSAVGLVLRRWGVSADATPGSGPRSAETVDRRRGKLDRVREIERRIANRERQLSAEQVPELADTASTSKGLIAHYPLDGPTNNEIPNAVPGEAGGTYTGSGQPAWVDGIVGGSLRLGGERGVGSVECRGQFQPDNDDAFSYGCWCLPGGGPYGQALIAKMDSHVRRGFDVVLKGGRVQVNFRHVVESDDLKVMTLMRVDDDVWHHVFVTYDGTGRADGVRIFVDGRPAPVEVARDGLKGSIRCSRPLSIGERDGQYFFRGMIDEVRIYNRQLSADEVRQLWADGVSVISQIPAAQRTEHQANVLAKYHRSRDGQLQDLLQELKVAQAALWKLPHSWYVNAVGMNMLVLSVPEKSEAYGQSPVKIPFKPFAICDREVSVVLFQRFVNETGYFWTRQHPGISPTDDHPAEGPSWFDAIHFCNWLSETESLPLCYKPSEKADEWEFTPEAYGYRLPTEKEWEYACRAGSTTDCCFGNLRSLLDDYAVFGRGQVAACAAKLPNAWGLFDMHGNAAEWCQDLYLSPDPDVNEDCRVVRGGSYGYAIWKLRSDVRSYQRPSRGGPSVGLRVARTLRKSPYAVARSLPKTTARRRVLIPTPPPLSPDPLVRRSPSGDLELSDNEWQPLVFDVCTRDKYVSVASITLSFDTELVDVRDDSGSRIRPGLQTPVRFGPEQSARIGLAVRRKKPAASEDAPRASEIVFIFSVQTGNAARSVRVQMRPPKTMARRPALASAERDSSDPGAQAQAAVLMLKKTFPDARKLVGSAAKPSWSHDGNTIVCGKMPFGAGLQLVDVKTGDVSDLVDAGKDPAWAPIPDGLIAYVRGHGVSEEIWVVAGNGSAPVKLAKGSFPVWAADGKTLFYNSLDEGQIMKVSFAAEVQTPQPILNSSTLGQHVAVSPDGGKLACWLRDKASKVSDDSNGKAAVIECSTGRTIITLADKLKGGFLAGWSWDGRYVVGGNYGYEYEASGLWIVDVQTQMTKLLCAGPFTCAAWSPDGTKIAFDRRTVDFTSSDYLGHDIWVIGIWVP